MFPLNLPNALTVIRILLVPVMVVALLVETRGGSFVAAFVFALAAATDTLDGRLARSRKLVTTFGKVMDPIADKLLIVAALLALVSLGDLPAWVAMVIITREVAVTGLRMAVAGQGSLIPASRFGKVKTNVQVVTVFAVIAAPDPTAPWVWALIWLTVVVTVASGLDYFLNVRRRSEPARAAPAPPR